MGSSLHSTEGEGDSGMMTVLLPAGEALLSSTNIKYGFWDYKKLKTKSNNFLVFTKLNLILSQKKNFNLKISPVLFFLPLAWSGLISSTMT